MQGKKTQKLMVGAVLYVLSVFSVSAVLNRSTAEAQCPAFSFCFLVCFFPLFFYSQVEVVA